MNEIKIAERIIIDQPQNVEIAIYNLTGKRVSFEISDILSPLKSKILKWELPTQCF